jgi:hypothetical protein
MGLHQRGKANSLIKLYNAPDWRDRVHLLNRDCAQFSVVSQSEARKIETQTVIGPASTGISILDLGIQAAWSYTSTDITTFVSNDWAGSSVVIRNAAVSTTNCIHNNLATSTLPKSFFASDGEYGEAFFPSTLASGQPFLFAGDTILTATCDPLDPLDILRVPDCVVEVHRIYGAEDNQFTLVNTNNKFPAKAVPDTPDQVISLLAKPQDALSIPYSFTTNAWMQNPAAASSDAIFYAVNPYWQLYTGFLSYCYNPNELGQLQLVATSSFSPITIWRVYTYVYCPPSQSAGCHEGLVQGIQIPDSQRPRLNAEDCSKEMDFYVTGMEYINTENIAISVLRARPMDIHPRTLVPSGNKENSTSTRTYFLNTATMQLRLDKAWESEIPQAVLTQGQLCPSLRRMPQLGSVLTSTAVASLLFLQVPFQVLINFPLIIDKWSSPTPDKCPLITRGHSFLLTNCGANALSLKKFFNAAENANMVLFRSLAMIGKLVSATNIPGSAVTQTFLNGVKIYGQETTNPLIKYMVGRQMTEIINAPIDYYFAKLFTSVLRMPSFLTAFMLLSSPVRTTNHVYHLIVDLVYRIVRASKTGEAADKVFFNAVYDSRNSLTEQVTRPTLNACAGLSLMAGYTNPWALFIRYQCNAWAQAPGNILDFLNIFMVYTHIYTYIYIHTYT